MTTKKVCKKCRVFIEGDKCPSCGGNQFNEAWKGRIFVRNPEESDIAKKIGISKKGTYAIKVK